MKIKNKHNETIELDPFTYEYHRVDGFTLRTYDKYGFTYKMRYIGYPKSTARKLFKEYLQELFYNS